MADRPVEHCEGDSAERLDQLVYSDVPVSRDSLLLVMHILKEHFQGKIPDFRILEVQQSLGDERFELVLSVSFQHHFRDLFHSGELIYQLHALFQSLVAEPHYRLKARLATDRLERRWQKCMDGQILQRWQKMRDAVERLCFWRW